MSLSAALVGKIIWVVGVVAWYFIRRPHARRAARVRTVRDKRSQTEKIALAVALLGMSVIPAIYLATGFPRSANYPASILVVVAGAACYFTGLWLFRRTHKILGRNWSISLEIRDRHELISDGPYARVRHPMYTSFLLMAVGQALLLPNWFVGLAGLLGFAVLFFLRVDAEERMMLEVFGEEYRDYMGRTKRIIPYIY